MTNPFSTHLVEPGAVRFLARGGEIEQQLARIVDGGQFAIVGAHGTGKTTLLNTLRSDLERRGHATATLSVHDAGTRRWRRACAGRDRVVHFVDGYEQLSWIERGWLRLRCRTLVVTAHAPVLTVLKTTRVSSSLAIELAERLVAPFPDCPIDPSEAATVLSEEGGNMRETLFRLYDMHQGRERVRAGTVENRR